MRKNTWKLLKLFRESNIDFYLYGGFAIELPRYQRISNLYSKADDHLNRTFNFKKNRKQKRRHKDIDIFINTEYLNKIKQLVKDEYVLFPIKDTNKVISFNILDNNGSNLEIDIKLYKEFKLNREEILSFSNIIISKIFLIENYLVCCYGSLKIKLLPLVLLYIFTISADRHKSKEVKFLISILSQNMRKETFYILQQNIKFYQSIQKYNLEIKKFVDKLKYGLKILNRNS